MNRRSSLTEKRSNVDVKDYWYYIVGAILLILLALIIAYNVSEPFKTAIKNTFSNISLNKDDIKDLEIIFFMKPDCPYCKEMISIFEKEGTIDKYMLINVDSEEGEKLRQMYNVDMFPTFISNKLKTGLKGSRKDSKEIIEELKLTATTKDQIPSEDEQLATIFRDLNLIMFKSSTCGHCNKMLQQLQEVGFDKLLEIVEVNSPDGQRYLSEFGIDANEGVPMFYSRTTSMKVVGARPIPDLIAQFN